MTTAKSLSEFDGRLAWAALVLALVAAPVAAQAPETAAQEEEQPAEEQPPAEEDEEVAGR